ncbi:hypothetical protein GYMLUDRAFT_260304 [Collybiopsis luxurians FD-317 M1]|uniref:Uncharacterized protein n=1 Tax=Collybiopsis luxurians FD-317 M1 TaxID=944289 RepID=A0A0D0CIU8_9AGAR|nr:hypothetical protein GYMLUDRAFT_260304 [Collybiopsis luxurians FD-317 M1]
MPQLKKLDLGYLGVSSIGELFALNCWWDNLTELVFYSTTTITGRRFHFGPMELLAILERTPQLRLCRADVAINEPFHFPHSHNKLKLKYLHTMILAPKRGTQSFPDGGSVQAVSRAICALTNFPSLHTISISTGFDSYLKMQDVLFPSPLQNLMHLRLEILLSPQSLAKWLISASNLTILEITDLGYMPPSTNRAVSVLKNHHLANLCSAQSPANVCPHLTTFRFQSLRTNRLSSLPSNVFLDFLERKRWPAAPSQISRLEVCDLILSGPDEGTAPAIESVERWKKLHQDGLKLSVHYHTYYDSGSLVASKERDSPEECLP